jgi:hypothetical protein
MAWSDAARAAALATRRAHSKGTKYASRISRNLGGPAHVQVSHKQVKTKKARARLMHNMRMNLTPGGYATAIYRAQIAAYGRKR